MVITGMPQPGVIVELLLQGLQIFGDMSGCDPYSKVRPT